MPPALKYQIFPYPVELPDKDAERLRPVLAGYHTLLRELPTLNKPDLQRCAILEMMGERRWEMVERILRRLRTLDRIEMNAKARRAMR